MNTVSAVFKFLLTMTLMLTTAVVWAQEPRANKDVFPDTPENRAFFADTMKQLKALDSKRGHVAKVNGIDMHYLEWGDKSGVPLIWSHGFSSSRFELAQVGDALAAAGFHVISISYRGHEKTQVSDYNFSLADVADDIAALMDQKGFAKAIIGGLSFGGGVTTTFYENYPQRVLGIILEDGGSVPNLDMGEKTYRLILDQTGSAQAPPEPVFSDPFLMFQFLERIYGAGWGGALPSGSEICIAGMIDQKKDGTWVNMAIDGNKIFGNYIPGWSGKLPLAHLSWLRIMPEITYRNLSVPMLIIDPTGDDKEFMSFVPMNTRLAKLHPDLIKHVQYPDTPHAAHPMRPEWFVRDMKDLLQRVKAQRR